jgi:hypothetical protein
MVKLERRRDCLLACDANWAVYLSTMECQGFTVNLARYITFYLSHLYIFETGKIPLIIAFIYTVHCAKFTFY